jgi:hypothetical protein
MVTEMTEKELKFALKAVKAARKLGVISMKLGSLEFELDPSRDDGSTRVRRSTSKVTAKRMTEESEDAQLSLEIGRIKSDLSTMHVEDPLGFERGLIENVIGDGGDDFEAKEDTYIS